MRNVARDALRLALIGSVAITAAACASRPKPPPTGPAPQAGATQGGADTGMAQGPTAPAPGSVQDFVINVGDRVYFDFDSYTVRADATPILDGQAGWLQRYPNVRVRIEGNADERGTREYNLALGARRANSVREYLVTQGVAATRIETVSYGKERPIDPGASEDAYQRNRNAHTAITSGAVGGGASSGF
jgi:peptidoglycan-associated lipoprotein